MTLSLNSLKQAQLPASAVTVTEVPDAAVGYALAELWRFENNRCVEVWAQFSDQEAWDDFWK